MSFNAERFPVRFSLKGTVPFWIVFGLFFFGGWIFRLAANNEVAFNAMVVVSSIAVFLMFVSIIPVGTHYLLDRDALLLRRLWFRERWLLAEIDECKILAESEVRELFQNIQWQGMEAAKTMDLTNAWKVQKKQHLLMRYLSTPVIIRTTRAGGTRPYTVEKINVRYHGPAIYLKNKNGRECLVSPRDPELMVRRLSERIALAKGAS